MRLADFFPASQIGLTGHPKPLKAQNLNAMHLKLFRKSVLRNERQKNGLQHLLLLATCKSTQESQTFCFVKTFWLFERVSD